MTTRKAFGWSAGMKQLDLGQNTADGDTTAPERHGKGFVRSAADDMEPSLGAPDLIPGDFYVMGGRYFDVPADQTRWTQGVMDDREGDLADTSDDREHDPAESGIGDDSGLTEQMMRHHGIIAEDQRTALLTDAS